MTDPIARLDADLARLELPTARLHRVAEVRAELEHLADQYAQRRAAAIVDARERGRMTWQQIGDVLGVSLQRAHELGKVSPPQPTERTPQ